MKPTRYDDVNKVLDVLTKGLISILDSKLIGVYLTGSLTYGDFDRGSSDIDFLVILENTLTTDELLKIKRLHETIGKDFPTWEKRIEGSYVTKKMASENTPPEEPRPYVNGGKMWEFVYGNEWVINLYALYHCGIALYGPKPKQLLKPVSIAEVRRASNKDLWDEWQPKMKDSDAFKDADYDTNHLQAYAILTLCRILYRAHNEDIASKRVASTWVKETYGEPWSILIAKAEQWEHGSTLNSPEEVKRFIGFVMSQVEK